MSKMAFFAVFVVGFLFAAFFSAWLDEHDAKQVATKELTRLNQAVTALETDNSTLSDQLKTKPREIIRAIKAPDEPLRIVTKSFGFGQPATMNGKSGTVLIITSISNKTFTSVDMKLACNTDFEPIGGPNYGGANAYVNTGTTRIDSHTYKVLIGSPVWHAGTPMGVPVFIENLKDFRGCELTGN